MTGHGGTGLYVIVDPDACVDPVGARRDPIAVCEAALRGGAGRVQLRTKGWADRAQLALARALAERCRAAGVPFVMNDRVDLALLSGADEVHLGQDDLALADARRLAPSLALARSTHDLEQLRAACAEGADRVAFGPVFGTQSKVAAEPTVGLERLAEAVRVASRPLIAIGGIDVTRARVLAPMGLAEVAVISAVCGAADVERAAAALREALA